jgi:type I restriction enzyme S subunit
MRVVPNIKKIKPGYLYAFLSSKYGNSIIKQGTFGAIVDTIETDFVSSIPIPMFSESLMKEVHQLIEESARLRSEANLMICALRDEINLFLKENYPLIKKGPLNTSQVKSSSILKFEKRLDSPFNIGFGRTLFNKIMESPFISLNNVAKVFHPILFGKKQLKGFLPKGNPLYKSSSMLKLNIETDFILSNKHLDKYEKLRVKEGWILVSRTGTIGNIVRISKKLSGIFIDDHMIRIIPQKKYSGIIFLFLSSSIGNELVKFQKYGSVQDVMKDKMIKRIPIPKSLLTNENIEKYDIEIIESFKKLDSASFLEEKAISMVEEELN